MVAGPLLFIATDDGESPAQNSPSRVEVRRLDGSLIEGHGAERGERIDVSQGQCVVSIRRSHIFAI